jgi:4-hydroxy-3-polyprenylbenzoate decarboxylase
MPAIPAFYHQPRTIDDLVTQYIDRVLAQIHLPQENMFRWTGQVNVKKAEA